MPRIPVVRVAVAALLAPLLYVADPTSGDLHGVGLVRQAHAIVGAPWTPMSCAGVARRTTRRVVAAETAAVTAAATTAAAPHAAGVPVIGTVVPTLPSGCAPLQAGGVEYCRCGETDYRAAFQGSNLVCVVQPKS
jgi:hypothetical protein